MIDNHTSKPSRSFQNTRPLKLFVIPGKKTSDQTTFKLSILESSIHYDWECLVHYYIMLVEGIWNKIFKDDEQTNFNQYISLCFRRSPGLWPLYRGMSLTKCGHFLFLRFDASKNTQHFFICLQQQHRSHLGVK